MYLQDIIRGERLNEEVIFVVSVTILSGLLG